MHAYTIGYVGNWRFLLRGVKTLGLLVTYKACWDIISKDFYELMEDYYHGSVDLKSINSSFIMLIPKKDNPQLLMILDYPCSTIQSRSSPTSWLTDSRKSFSSCYTQINMDSYKLDLFKIVWHGLLRKFISANNQNRKLCY